MQHQQSQQQHQQQQQQQPQQPQQPQAPAPQQQPQTATQPEASNGHHQTLTVSGCVNPTMAQIVNGDFVLFSQNHGKPVYKKKAQWSGSDVMLYFWDDRDGPVFCGWWFGPAVGGDQVWAFHPDKAASPPSTGWKVPCNGPVDQGLQVVATSGQQAASQQTQQQQQQQQAAAAAAAAQQAEQQAALLRQQQEAEQQRQQQLWQQQQWALAQAQEQQKARQAALEDQRRKIEEANRAKQEELKRKQEEQVAVLNIRRAFQKIRGATSENFEEFQKELMDLCNAELPKTGANADNLRTECEKVLEAVKARLEAVKAAKQKELERKEAVEKMKKEQQEKMVVIVQELTASIEAAEAAAKEVEGLEDPFEEVLKADKPDLDSLEAVAEASAEKIADATAKVKVCTDFLHEKRSDMQIFKSPALGLEAAEPKQAMALLLNRLKEATKLSEGANKTFKEKKEAAVKKASAIAKLKAAEETFKKFDKDKDGYLSEKEVVAYAKSLYKETIPAAQLKKIMESLTPDGAKGVPLTRFSFLRAAVGTAHELSEDQKRRKAREEKEKAMKAIQEKLREKIKGAEGIVDKALQDVLKAEDKAAEMRKEVLDAPFEEHESIVAHTEKQLKASRTHYERAKKTMTGLSAGQPQKYAKEIEDFLAIEGKSIRMRMNRMELRLSRVANMVMRVRDEAKAMGEKETRDLKENLLKAIRFNAQQQGKTLEALFDIMDANSNGELEEEELQQWFTKATKEIVPVVVEKAKKEEPAAATPATATATATAATAEEEVQKEAEQEGETDVKMEDAGAAAAAEEEAEKKKEEDSEEAAAAANEEEEEDNSGRIVV
mmetsp:Transcript_19764/g.42853  ORF Transcript_19764/g.42853 Transcript_19764/m.42853 type:complete len:832 (-) Transcript_19764:92-2587(-)